jgi:hypothetical protein
MKKAEHALRAKYLAIFREREKDTDLPVAAFCRKRGISAATFYRWKNIFGLPPRRDSPRKRFIPVTVAPLSAPTDGAGCRYDFRFPNGATLQISGSLDTGELSEIIRSIGTLAS